MSCEACANPGQGLTHSCPESGTFVAAEAHLADEVDQIAEEWPRFMVTTHFRMRADSEASVRTRLTGMMAALLDDDLVEDVDFSLEQIEVGA